MSEKNSIKKGDNRKNVCRICDKKIFEDGEEFASCVNTKKGYRVCLPCAYSIELAMYKADFLDDIFDEEDDEEMEQMQSQNLKVNSYSFDIKELPKRKEVIKEIQKCIIGQDESVVRIVHILYRNFLSENKELKSTPLLIGKSGNGKTEIITEFCKLLNVPFVLENAKDFSEAGYVGRDPMEVFTDLYNVCGKNVELANQGIVIIDEVDKLRQAPGAEKDVSGSGVINTFLSYISGVKVPIKDKYDNILAYVNTENIKFIFLGAFEDAGETDSLYKIRKKRLSVEKHIGFNPNIVMDSLPVVKEKHFIAEDLIKYGFSRQFVGRVSIIELNELSKEDLMKIMLESQISTYRAFEREFASYGLNMICSDTLKQNVIEKAFSKNIGARGIKVVCEETFLQALEEVENMDEIIFKEVIFGDDAVENPSNYTFK